MAVIRAYPDPAVQGMIVSAATAFEERLSEAHAKYREAVEKSNAIPTERVAREIMV